MATHTFQDNEGRTYVADVTVATAIALKKINVDLNQLGDGDLLQRLADDPELLVNTLWLTVEKSALAQGVTQEQFPEGLGGDAIAAAIEALMEAIVSFCRPSQRQVLKTVLAKGREVETLMGQQALAKAEALTPEQILNSLNSVSSRPELPGSIPSP